MRKSCITRPTLERLPLYLDYIRSNVDDDMISASAIARGLGLGEVTVRRDLSRVCREGRPKIGYPTRILTADIEALLGVNGCTPAIIVGTGRLGLALLGYKGFEEYGLKIAAGFDIDPAKADTSNPDHPVYILDELEHYCRIHEVSIGILTVPAEHAQSVCDRLTGCGITAIWNFAPYKLSVPDGVTVRQENLALSLAHLHVMAQQNKADNK